MASNSPYQLNSTKTALAILVPVPLRSELNSLRQIHDKSFSTWEAHINIVYPFITPSSLSSAIPLLRSALTNQERKISNLDINISEVGVFPHRRNATVFLKPSRESEDELCRLRRILVKVLGCQESDGTFDGVFRPHLSVGQAKLGGDAVSKLVEKVEELVGLRWEAVKLVVLERQISSGRMEVVDEICLGGDEMVKDQEGREVSDDRIMQTRKSWRSCYTFDIDTGWRMQTIGSSDSQLLRTGSMTVQVLTYNLMADERAPAFATRLPLITQTISNAVNTSATNIKVLCLQEINDEMLPLLLNDPFICTTFPFCTHTPSTYLPSHRNLVTLASAPFQYFNLRFAERHKTALITEFGGHGGNLAVANVHLTSSLTDRAVIVKKNQMDTLTRFLEDLRRDEGEEEKVVIVAGDFNLTTSSRTLETAVTLNLITNETAQLVPGVIDPEVWEDPFLDSFIDEEGGEVFDGEQGATFDRLTNPLASLSEVVVDNRPQRYDRVIFMKGGKREIHSESCTRFGMPEEGCAVVGSDHFGANVILGMSKTTGGESGSPSPISTPKKLQETQISEIEVIQDTTDIRLLLEPYLPTHEDREQRKQALSFLEKSLTSSPLISQLVFAPLGSYAMDTYFPDSDIDLLVIGTVSPQIFFDIATKQLLRPGSEDEGANKVKGVHLVNSLVSIMEANVRGVKLDLQYCQAAEILERYLSVKETVPLSTVLSDPTLLSTLSPSSLRPLNTYRDTQYLIQTNPCLESFQSAYRYLSLFLRTRGLYSARFGYLGGIHLSLMLNHVVKLIITKHDQTTKGKGEIEISPATLIRTFITYYSTFNWAHSSISDPHLSSQTNMSRSPRDALFIPSIHIPTARLNVASSCTRLSCKTLTIEFAHAASRLSEGVWKSNIQNAEINIREFLSEYGAYILVAIDIWDIDPRDVVGCLESRVPRLLVSLGRIGGVEARIWPGRFCERAKSLSSLSSREETLSGQEMKGYYVFGIRAGKGLDAQEKNLSTSKILSTIREFETSMHTAREFLENEGNLWVSVELTTRKKIQGLDLVLDEWGSGNEMPNVNEPKPESNSSTPTSPITSPTTLKSSPSKQSAKSTSLRPAQDVIARIHWDPQLNADDFLIGYEDRFVGVKEMELKKWKSEATDEEFIPRHRIVWIRRKDEEEDGDESGNEKKKVWDRRRKIDLLFGSGVSGGGGT